MYDIAKDFCGDFLRLWEDFYEIYKIFNGK